MVLAVVFSDSEVTYSAVPRSESLVTQRTGRLMIVTPEECPDLK